MCLRSQSRPADHADQFGFNEPVRQDVLARHGRDITREPFDAQAWRDLLGEYLTELLRELRHALGAGTRLGVGVPRGDVLGPPLGNTTAAWREWLSRRLVDVLVVGQNSSQCPSMWHQLWPMHRGTGYIQDYLQERGLPPVADYADLARATGAELFIARQWHERSATAEDDLRAIPGVTGLVFSSFRHDNPSAIARGQWRAGRLEPHDAALPGLPRASGFHQA